MLEAILFVLLSWIVSAGQMKIGKGNVKPIKLLRKQSDFVAGKKQTQKCVLAD